MKRKRKTYYYEVVTINQFPPAFDEFIHYAGASRAEARAKYDDIVDYTRTSNRVGVYTERLELRAWIVPDTVRVSAAFRKFSRRYPGNWMTNPNAANIDTDEHDALMNCIYSGPGYKVLKHEGGPQNEK